MAERNEQVFQRVREELGKSPTKGSRELYEMAQEADAGIAKDTLQQFHARYVLPIKREQSGSKGGRKARRGKKAQRRARAGASAAVDGNGPSTSRRKGGRKVAAASEKDRVRGVLLEFARDFADAESRSEIVQVLSRVDEYVDRIAPGG